MVRFVHTASIRVREKLRQWQPAWAFVDARLLLLQEHPLLRWAYFRWSRKGIYFPRISSARLIATGPWLPLRQKHVRLKDLRIDAPHTSPEPLPPEADFLVTYTSGTTSQPERRGAQHRGHYRRHPADCGTDPRRA